MGFIKRVGMPCDSRAGKLSDNALKNMLHCGTTTSVPREKSASTPVESPTPHLAIGSGSNSGRSAKLLIGNGERFFARPWLPGGST
jgi:hypothetical protein